MVMATFRLRQDGRRGCRSRIPGAQAEEAGGGGSGIMALGVDGEGGYHGVRQAAEAVGAENGEVVRVDAEREGSVDIGQEGLVGLVAEVGVAEVGVDTWQHGELEAEESGLAGMRIVEEVDLAAGGIPEMLAQHGVVGKSIDPVADAFVVVAGVGEAVEVVGDPLLGGSGEEGADRFCRAGW